MPSELLKPEEAARRLGVSVSYLSQLRVQGRSPTFIRLGAHAVRYRPEDLDAWVAARAATSTSAYSREGGR